MSKKFKFIIEKTGTGYSAYEEKLAVGTTGKNILELQKNALEALELFFEDQPGKIRLNQLEFEIDLKQFFEYYKVINAKHLAKRIGMKESLLSQYVTGNKKPSRKQTERILDGLHEIGKELMEINLT